MSIERKVFGKLPTREDVYVYILDNKSGLRAEILTYGGIIKNLWVKNKSSEEIDVVLGRDSLSEYLDNDGYLGAAVGRMANRIKDAHFFIDGQEYKIGANEGKNSLHGGFCGFDKKIWTAQEAGEENSPSLILTAQSPDGEEGFPGKLDIKITYTLTSENALVIEYEAVSDKDTVVNLTNHSYFNLNGHASGDILGHTLWIDSDFYTPNTSECMPSGEILKTVDTPFDFREPKPIGKDIDSGCEQLEMFGGYDHNFVINGRGMRKGACLSGDKSGIMMEMYTDKPGVQIYTANALDEERICKDGAVYKKHQAVCLETQIFPNSTSFSHFPSPILRKGEKYSYRTEYRFKTI